MNMRKIYGVCFTTVTINYKSWSCGWANSYFYPVLLYKQYSVVGERTAL